MRERDIAIAWIALAVVFLLALAWELSSWRDIRNQGDQVSAELRRLTAEISQREQEIVREARANAGLLQEMSWTATGADPAAFIRRVADLAQGSRLKVTAIGSIERQSTPQFIKSWHTIEITGPYQELKGLAGKVEGERGILENVSVTEAPKEGREAALREVQRLGAGQAETEVQAKFRITSMELTQATRDILNRASQASGIQLTPTAPPGTALGLPVPTTPAVAGAAPAARDPFVFGVPPPTRPVVASGTKTEGVELQGIVGFPGGYLAIVDNTIVKVGDKVKGNRVEDITERGVLLRQPNGAPRRLTLPDIAVPAAQQPGPARQPEQQPPAAPPQSQPPQPGPPSPGPRR